METFDLICHCSFAKSMNPFSIPSDKNYRKYNILSWVKLFYTKVLTFLEPASIGLLGPKRCVKKAGSEKLEQKSMLLMQLPMIYLSGNWH